MLDKWFWLTYFGPPGLSFALCAIWPPSLITLMCIVSWLRQCTVSCNRIGRMWLLLISAGWLCVCLWLFAGWHWWREHWELPILPAPFHDPMAEGRGLQRHNRRPEEVSIGRPIHQLDRIEGGMVAFGLSCRVKIIGHSKWSDHMNHSVCVCVLGGVVFVGLHMHACMLSCVYVCVGLHIICIRVWMWDK